MIEAEIGSGNVFADLGYADPEAALAKSQIRVVDGALDLINKSHAWGGVALIYAVAAHTLASAGPLPLASTEPWAESDQAYRARLADYLGYDVTYSGSMLDDYGVEAAELPRARLVQVAP